MKTIHNFALSQSKDRVSVLLTTGIILLIPLFAMQFTNEVQWNLFDFIVAGILLLSTGFLVVAANRKITNGTRRAVIITGLLITLCLVWAELAVGIFNSPFAGS